MPPEFLAWLTDPVKNGAGALFDFGCYGAEPDDLADGRSRPLAVTAVTQQIKPQIYPKVDDEATILLDYPQAEGDDRGVLELALRPQGPRGLRRDGLCRAVGGNLLRVRARRPRTGDRPVAGAAADERDSLTYFAAVVRGRKPSGLSSLANNIIVTEILEAARDSAASGNANPAPRA